MKSKGTSARQRSLRKLQWRENEQQAPSLDAVHTRECQMASILCSAHYIKWILTASYLASAMVVPQRAWRLQPIWSALTAGKGLKIRVAILAITT
ncbi:hypothetical protein D3C87_1143890 [compost metagenome]